MEPDDNETQDSPTAQTEETDLQEASDRVEGGEPVDVEEVSDSSADGDVGGESGVE